MTKDEGQGRARKNAEGDPVIKNKQKQKMMQVAGQPHAPVRAQGRRGRLANPTHLAVALRYNAQESPAPIVIAKGADHLAEKIKEIARQNNVPVCAKTCLWHGLCIKQWK